MLLKEEREDPLYGKREGEGNLVVAVGKNEASRPATFTVQLRSAGVGSWLDSQQLDHALGPNHVTKS